MPQDIKPNPLALITGGARRIGRAIALDLARKGFDIAIHYHKSQKEADEAVDLIKNLGRRAISLSCNLSAPSDLATLLPRCCSALGSPTCLINNASEFMHDTLETMTEQRWNTHFDINLRAPVFLAQAFPHHLPQGAEGNIINIIDQRVWKLTPDFFSYTLSKAGLWTATQTLAQALAPLIRVNAIGPGPVLKNVHQSEGDFAKEVQSTLLKRGPSPEEIANAVFFILNSNSITGQMIALDGGQHLVWDGN
ncbi:MAG: SDR family oxidoreductase [Hyphomicrobium sp.]